MTTSIEGAAPPESTAPHTTPEEHHAPQALRSRDTKPINPLWVRITHWLNAFAVVIMVLSGWRIYDASPIFPSWMGGALQWHFAAMWLVFGCGLVYLTMNLFTGRFFRKFFPLSPKAVIGDLVKALTGKLGHEDLRHFNAVQKLAYLSVVVALIVVVLSGLAIWKSVQLPLLRDLMGGYDTARVVHFCAMTFIVLFFFVHIAMVALVPRSLLTMLRGR